MCDRRTMEEHCRHIETEEETMWDKDCLQDDTKPLIIQVMSTEHQGNSSTEQTSGLNNESGEDMEGITELE